jgi:hypothetical protein
MPKYRKKPVVIEAWQFTKENFTRSKEPNWLKEAIMNKEIALWSQYGRDVIEGEISTLEGTMTISENDFIIKGVNGEFYPCKPDIFEKTYDLVEN